MVSPVLYHFNQQTTGLASVKKHVEHNRFLSSKKSVFDDDDFEVNEVVDERALNPSDFFSQAVTADEIQEAIAGLPVSSAASIYVTCMGRF